MEAEIQAEFQALVSAADVLQTTQLCRVAVIAVVLYDHALTFRQEVELIWKRAWSLTTFLFLLTRYGGGLVLIATAPEFLSTFLSETAFVFSYFKVMGVMSTSQGIMQMRIYAMSQKSKKILALMLVSFVAEIVANVVFLQQFYNSGRSLMTLEPVPGFRMCSVTKTDQNFMDLYIPTLCFESLLLALSLLAGFRDAARTRQYSGRWTMGPTMRVLIMYNTLYFFAALAVSAGSMGVPAQYLYIIIGFTLATLMVLATRLVLAVRTPSSLPNMLDDEGSQGRFVQPDLRAFGSTEHHEMKNDMEPYHQSQGAASV
ncbi:hypothetical protein BV22DRAFT_1125011 [Leucogyrophana mollusca]|uniref:Uncharacterized protein n=1 Tax=Leucogyrophana mollusca TaxID=85980 RepID=A0ACB8BXY3_9AGAM|nr:hypothetical protein BV22DRAFT_1125011 [Leucogyrophana mollusca]